MPPGVDRMDSFPRVILVPGLGALCSGKDAAAADINRDIAAHTLAIKAQIAAMGAYCGMDERDLFEMEYRTLQHTKLQGDKALPLARQVALITGAAGAIGSGIAEELLEQGCHVALTDLPGDALTRLVEELEDPVWNQGTGSTPGYYRPCLCCGGFRNRHTHVGRDRSDCAERRG